MMIASFFLVTFLLFVAGAVVGSFLNVLMYRSITGESWVWGRSHCEFCDKQIAWYDNVPLLSFLILNGKCRYCRKPIAMTHPVIEFLTGTLFAWWYVGGTVFFRLTSQPFHYIQPLFWLAVGVLVLIVFFTDALYSLIPDEVVVLLAGMTFLYRISLTVFGVMQPMDFVRTLFGALLCSGFFFALWYFTKGKGMGFGDVKFAVPFALILGWPNVVVGTLLAFVLGGAVGGVLILTKKKKLTQTIPFGPFLVASLVITLVYGNQLLSWYFHLF